MTKRFRLPKGEVKVLRAVLIEEVMIAFKVSYDEMNTDMYSKGRRLVELYDNILLHNETSDKSVCLTEDIILGLRELIIERIEDLMDEIPSFSECSDGVTVSKGLEIMSETIDTLSKKIWELEHIKTSIDSWIKTIHREEQ